MGVDVFIFVSIPLNGDDFSVLLFVFFSPIFHFLTSQQQLSTAAFMRHASQIRWFRYFYCVFSRLRGDRSKKREGKFSYFFRVCTFHCYSCRYKWDLLFLGKGSFIKWYYKSTSVLSNIHSYLSVIWPTLSLTRNSEYSSNGWYILLSILLSYQGCLFYNCWTVSKLCCEVSSFWNNWACDSWFLLGCSSFQGWFLLFLCNTLDFYS